MVPDRNRMVVRIPGSHRVWKMILVGVMGLAVATLLLAGDKSLFHLISLYREQETLTARIERMREQNQRLEKHIADLKNSSQALERIAREELGLVRPDEIVYRFVPQSTHPDPVR